MSRPTQHGHSTNVRIFLEIWRHRCAPRFLLLRHLSDCYWLIQHLQQQLKEASAVYAVYKDLPAINLRAATSQQPCLFLYSQGHHGQHQRQ
jgi:hypothetical protein